MNNYQLVHPENFTSEHHLFIEHLKSSISFLSSQTGDLIGAKDVNSRYIFSTDPLAKIFGCKNGVDMEGRFDIEMPCDGTTQYAAEFIKEDQLLLNTQDTTACLSSLSIHNYADGLKARSVKRHLLHHKESKSILGVVCSGHTLEIRDFINIIPNYIAQFGGMKTATSPIDRCYKIGDVFLNEYEQEVCFLLMLNWTCRQIAEYMNVVRPIPQERTADTIIKKKNYICHKLHLPLDQLPVLQEYLYSINFHKSIPNSFYLRMIGSRVIEF